MSSMAVWVAIVIAVSSVGRAASNGCSLGPTTNASSDATGTVFTAFCEQRCVKWTINVTSYSYPLGGRCGVLPCLLNAASWDPDVINVTADLRWSVSDDGTKASMTLVNGQALIEISCFLDWRQIAPFGKALIEQTSLPIPTTTTNALPSDSKLSSNSTTVMDNFLPNTSDDHFTYFPTTTTPSSGRQTTNESSMPLAATPLAATPLATPVLPNPSSTSVDGVDEILLEPVSVRLLPSDGNEAVFLCRMKTSDPFVIINDSLTYPGTFIKDVSIRAVSSDDRQYWNVTVVVKANQNSTKVQCLSTVGNTTSAANLLVVGPPLPPNPRLFLPFDASAVRLTWQKPFTWSDVADITNYTIRVFSTANYVWSSMTIKIIESANDHSFACDLSTKACTPLGQNHKDFVVARSGSLAVPQFTVTPLFRPNGAAVLTTEIQVPNLCSGQSVSYAISVTNFNNLTVYALNLTKTYPHCNVISVTDVVSGKAYMVTVIVNTFGGSTNNSYRIDAPLRWSPTVSSSPSSTTGDWSGSVQGCQVQNSIVAAVSGLLGLLLLAACVISAVLMWRIRARRKKILEPVRVERSNPLYELGMSHPYEQVNMKMRPLPPEPASPNEDRYFMSPQDRSSRDISLPECQKTETEVESPTVDFKTGVMVL
eukprot:Em0006g330a